MEHLSSVLSQQRKNTAPGDTTCHASSRRQQHHLHQQIVSHSQELVCLIINERLKVSNVRKLMARPWDSCMAHASAADLGFSIGFF
jgi:hypothetical protein